MPEQKSERGEPVTGSPFTAPFETPIFPLGVGGLDLASALDKIAIGRFSRLTNCLFTPGESRELTGRPGQVTLATGGTEHHSIARLNDPQNSTFTRIWGIDGQLYLGQAGALTVIDAGYSGKPLGLLPYRPTLSGDPWMFIADSARMRKVRADGLVVPIGLPAPSTAAVVGLAAEQRTTIEDFSSDVWTPNAGSVIVTTGALVPPPPVPVLNGPSLFEASSLPAGTGLPYYNFWGLAKTLNLNQVGSIAAEDEDLMHLRMSFEQPQLISEVRLYLVVSETFSPSVLPGNSTTVNQDFYVKSFSTSDFNSYVTGAQSAAGVATDSAARLASGQVVSTAADPFQKIIGQTTSVGNVVQDLANKVYRVNSSFAATQDPSRGLLAQGQGATIAEQEFGTIGVPLRRGDWQRFGTTAGRDWGTVTGLIISIHVQVAPGLGGPAVILHDWWLTGGAGPDTSEPATQSYDYRYTNYDTRTGAEGNPSPVMDPANFIDSLRRGVTIQPIPYGDAAVRQVIYRRGGTLVDDWFLVGTNDGDGAAFTDTETDLGIAASDTVAIDHYQPVPTVNDAGDTVLAQPVPVLFGPYNGQLLALGDPYRPGFVYASLPGAPDHWPPDLACEVCPSSEELMNGDLLGGQPFCFSRERMHLLYANLTGQNGMTATPSGCTRGLAGRRAMCVAYGYIWFVSNDGLYRTTGGPEELVSGDLWPIFNGKSTGEYRPIDFSAESALRLTGFENEIYFQYQDDQGLRMVMVYQIASSQWRAYTFDKQPAVLALDEGDSSQLLIGGHTTGTSYLFAGVSDAGATIQGKWRTGAWDYGRPREEKIFGDQILDFNSNAVAITLRNFLNTETIVNPIQNLNAITGRARAIFDGFGTGPQLGRNLSTEVVWVTDGPPPIFYFVGASITPQPDLTMNRVTNWDDLGHPDEKYVTGITLDCNTGGIDRTIILEGDLNGAFFEIATITVNANGRHKLVFSWPAVQANQVRIRPNDECIAWLLYRADWIWVPEPPRIARWDVHFENAWDQYYTGLDLYCDTFGFTKTVEVYVDETLIGTYSVTAAGRRVVHLTLPWGRGHVFRFRATDDNPGLLYQHRWFLQEEPSEQTNWNQNFSTLGISSDKWLKAIVFECDTFGADKSVQVEADGVAVETLTVNTDGRKVIQIALTSQQLGRVWRFFPVDDNPGRLYSAVPVFDVEPYQLDRWETQEQDMDLEGFYSVIDANVTLKSTADVTLTVYCQINQDPATVLSDAYVIPSTGGVKQKRYVPCVARKGVLSKFVFTSDEPFWLYREEANVRVQPWGYDQPVSRRMWGNDDLDRTRGMTNASLASARSGGGTG